MDDAEKLARFIAARKMGVRKDYYGEHLPAEFHLRYLEKATNMLRVVPLPDAIEIIGIFSAP